MSNRDRVSGIGGIFFRAKDASRLAAWYREHLGVPVAEGATHAVFASGADGSDGAGGQLHAVWVAVPNATDYFGPGQTSWMVNCRVADLDTMLAQLHEAGVWVDERIETSEFGRFGWAADLEGHRFELWQPPPNAVPSAERSSAGREDS